MIHNYSSGREEDKNELKKRIKLETMATWITRLEEFESGHLPFMRLLYKGKDSVHHTIPVVFIKSFILLHEKCRGKRYMVLLLGLGTSLIIHILVKWL